jgi:hypothetical protein
VPRSPDAPLAMFAAKKIPQQEELSGRHPNPAESRLLASVGRDCRTSMVNRRPMR